MPTGEEKNTYQVQPAWVPAPIGAALEAIRDEYGLSMAEVRDSLVDGKSTARAGSSERSVPVNQTASTTRPDATTSCSSAVSRCASSGRP